MSSTIAYTYHDPYKLPAGIATLAVHAIFFIVLYYGVRWQSQVQPGMVVDLWDSLPDVGNTPSMKVSPQESRAKQNSRQTTPRESERTVTGKADIDLGKRKKQPPKEEPKPKTRPMTRAEQKQARADMQAAIKQQELEEKQAMDARAKQAAAIGQMIDEYKAKIGAKIRRNIVPPPDVADDAVAEFDVTLLPGGDVLDARLTKSSGNQAYDSAVERAIWKARPLPVPEDPDLFNSRFRKLHLKFRPKDLE
jgi:colicin import membrane protein